MVCPVKWSRKHWKVTPLFVLRGKERLLRRSGTPCPRRWRIFLGTFGVGGGEAAYYWTKCFYWLPLSQSPLTPQTISGHDAELSFPGSKRRHRISPRHLALSFLPQPLHPARLRVRNKAKGGGWVSRRRALAGGSGKGSGQDRAEGALSRGCQGRRAGARPHPAAVAGRSAKRPGAGQRKQITVSQHSPLNNKASCKASGAVFVVPSAPCGGSGKGEPSAVGRGAPLRLIPGKDKEPPSHQLCLDSRPHKSSALFGLALQICQPDQLLKEKGPATPFFPLLDHDCPFFKGSRADLPAGVAGLVRPVSGPPFLAATHPKPECRQVLPWPGHGKSNC